MWSQRATSISYPEHERSAPAPHHEQSQVYQTWGDDAPFKGLWDVYSSSFKFASHTFVADSTTKRRFTYEQVLNASRALMHALTTELFKKRNGFGAGHGV